MLFHLWVCCELLSNLYLRHIENNPHEKTDREAALWIAFELVSSSYWKQPLRLYNGALHSCELLSNLYLRHIENNSASYSVTLAGVVNCFRTCIFVILKTTVYYWFAYFGELWIAFELVSSSYWKQHICRIHLYGARCELLSNLYLRHIENNSEKINDYEYNVVNCFRTCIFVILKTTCGGDGSTPEKLWIAFELVSSSYWKQPKLRQT